MWVYRTAVASLVAQVVIGAITSMSFFVTVDDPSARSDLNAIVALEVSSQAVEFVWYVVIVCRYATIRTWMRYIDWVVSTPVMLLSTALFFSHRDPDASLWSPLRGWTMYACVACDWFMLLCGYLVETGRVRRDLGIVLGSWGLVGTFTFLAMSLPPSGDALASALFWGVYGVWSLYGVAAVLPYEPKNIMYNLLDIVSKNVYGLLLFVYALSRS